MEIFITVVGTAGLTACLVLGLPKVLDAWRRFRRPQARRPKWNPIIR